MSHFFKNMISPNILKLIQSQIRSYSSGKKKFAVLISRKVDPKAAKIIESVSKVTEWRKSFPMPREDLVRELKGKDGLFCTVNDKINKDLLDKSGDKLKVVATMSVGYDHFQLDELKKRKIKAGHLPGVVTDATAETTVAILLATARRLLEANQAAKKGKWSAYEPYWMCGPGLKGTTVGIVGYGRIGQQVARLIKPFQVKKIIVFDKYMNVKEAKKVNAISVGIEELLKESDFITVNCALTPETRDMFNKKTFNKMKKNVVFVNVSRGPVVNQDALVEVLKTKRIFAAGLDVTTPEPLPPNHELYKLPNCLIIPHLGASNIQTRYAMQMMTAKNVLNALTGKPMPFELKL